MKKQARESKNQVNFCESTFGCFFVDLNIRFSMLFGLEGKNESKKKW